MKTYDKHGECETCGEDLFCLAPEDDWDGVVRFACGLCDAWQIECVDVVGIWTWASRDGSGKAWLWLPESVREACARAGFGFDGGGVRMRGVKDPSTVRPKRVLLDMSASTWASDGAAMFDLGVRWTGPADAVVRDAETEAELAGRPIAPVDVLACVDDDWAMTAGQRRVQARFVAMLGDLFPGCTWTEGARSFDPLSVHVGERLVALVMPLAPEGGAS